MQQLQVRELTITAQLRGGSATVVQSLSFVIPGGTALALVGESGSGKTMTAHALLGLLPHNCTASGQVLLDNRALLALPKAARAALLGRELVLVPQSGADSLTPHLRIGCQLRETLRRQGLRDRAACTARSRQLLAAVGLPDPDTVLASYPFQLSGGMAQRVVLAMGMAGNPRLVVADEPTRGVDSDTADRLLADLSTAFPQAALLLITHSLAVAERCQQLLVLRRGCMVEQGEARAVLQNPAHPYTRSLIAALPQNGLQLPQEGGWR